MGTILTLERGAAQPNVLFASDEEMQAFQVVAAPTETERAAIASTADAWSDEVASALLVDLDGEKTVHISGQEETKQKEGKEIGICNKIFLRSGSNATCSHCRMHITILLV